MSLTSRQRVALLAACAVVAALVALYAAAQSPAPTGGPPRGSVRLGPEPGEPVPAYLARAAATLPPPGLTALALVQLVDERTVADPLPAGTTVEAVFRVDLPRVQTALRFIPLEPNVPVATALDSARQRAASAATADAARLSGRARAVAVVEAAALGRADCACVVALVVAADGADLRRPAAGVRVVEAAPPGVTLGELALAPLLPEQADRADPLPDDGPVP